MTPHQCTHYTIVVPASQILQGHASMSIEKAGYNIIITQKKETGLASSALLGPTAAALLLVISSFSSKPLQKSDKNAHEMIWPSIGQMKVGMDLQKVFSTEKEDHYTHKVALIIMLCKLQLHFSPFATIMA